MSTSDQDRLGILASEDGIHNDTGNEHVWFHQTPKYAMDSTNQETLARFTVPPKLVSAIIQMYRGQTSSKTVLGKVLSKLQLTGGYIDFFINNISSSERDRYFLSETLGDNFTVFGLGKEPEVLSCSGVLKNTLQDDWQVQFLELFNKIGGIRALGKLYQYGDSTGLLNQNYLNFYYNKRQVRGALLNASTTLMASNEMDMALSFSFLVTKVIAEDESNEVVTPVTTSVTRTVRSKKGVTSLGKDKIKATAATSKAQNQTEKDNTLAKVRKEQEEEAANINKELDSVTDVFTEISSGVLQHR